MGATRDNILLLGALAWCGLADPYRPLLAQIVVTKRCNLSCAYCYEHDAVSPPVPLPTLREWIGHLERLRVVFVTLNGGEPLLHPDVVAIVSAIRHRGMTPMMNSNGFLLTEELVRALGRAGLFGLQISLDTLEPNETTNKALSLLRPKLELLAKHATFRVRVNTVLGSGPPSEAVQAVRVATEMGFDAQCSLVRDPSGSAVPLDPSTQEAYQEIRRLGGRLPAYLNDGFQLPLVRGEAVPWKCRSGARYFHVCADGLVHLCQPNEGTPGKALADYTVADIKKYFRQYKQCSPRCPHAYAHIGGRMDTWRRQSGP